jgi:hypothetical protein
MSRKWIMGLVALTAVAGTAFAAGTAFSTGADSRPQYSSLTVELNKERAIAARAKPGGGGTSKPEVVYLQSGTPTTINTADVSAGGFGPFIDLTLKGPGCSKVINGGAFPRSTDVYLQGSYVQSPKKFHVLLALDDAAAASSPRPVIQVDTSLICLKGVK